MHKPIRRPIVPSNRPSQNRRSNSGRCWAALFGWTLLALSCSPLTAQIPHVAERLPSIFEEEDGKAADGSKAAAGALKADADDSLEDIKKRLEKLEAGNVELNEEQESLAETVDEFTGDKTIAHAGTSKSTMKISGRIHIDAWGFPSNGPQIDLLEGGPNGPQARLGFRRMRLGVGGDLPSNMLYKLEMEFAGGNASEFRDVYLGWKDLPLFQTLLVGNQKRPYGLDHLNSSRYNVFIERPFVIESFNQDARRLGIASYGVSDNERWNWRYGVYNQRLIQDEGNYTNDHLQLEFASRLANTFWWDETSNGRGYGHWAISHSWARPDGRGMGDNGGPGPDQDEARFRHRPEARSATRWLDTGRIAGVHDYHLLGLENVWNFGSLQFVGEYQQIALNRYAGAGPDVFLWGGYFYVSYFLTGEHMPWKRSSGTLDRIKPFEDFFLVSRGAGWGAWQVAGRYSYADFNQADVMGGVGESFTFGLNWYWTQNAHMQFNWINGSITDNAFTRDAPLSGQYDIVGVRFRIDY